VVEVLSARHDVVVAGSQSGDVQLDISSHDSVRSVYHRIGSFDALACAAGTAHFGPFETATAEELALGVHSKLLGQMRLVLLGRSLISEGGSFTLISGYILDDPIPEATSFAVANGGVEGFVRAAALSLERHVRINAVSPGMAQDSYEQFGLLADQARTSRPRYSGTRTRGDRHPGLRPRRRPGVVVAGAATPVALRRGRGRRGPRRRAGHDETASVGGRRSGIGLSVRTRPVRGPTPAAAKHAGSAARPVRESP
jgi:Enoyl-(Acyl carrier protein) reductase